MKISESVNERLNNTNVSADELPPMAPIFSHNDVSSEPAENTVFVMVGDTDVPADDTVNFVTTNKPLDDNADMLITCLLMIPLVLVFQTLLNFPNLKR